MIYKQFNPHPALVGYIAAYWTAKGDGVEWKTEKILPDGCIDVILNGVMTAKRPMELVRCKTKRHIWLEQQPVS